MKQSALKQNIILIAEENFRLKSHFIERLEEKKYMLDEKIRIADFHRDNLKNIRKEMRIRTDTLSAMIHRAPSYISQIESGRIKTITRNNLEIIAQAIGCDVGIILCSDNCNNSNTDNYNMFIQENIALKKENEYLKKKLEDIAKVLNK